jgi:microcystin-dependent protein
LKVDRRHAVPRTTPRNLAQMNFQALSVAGSSLLTTTQFYLAMTFIIAPGLFPPRS